MIPTRPNVSTPDSVRPRVPGLASAWSPKPAAPVSKSLTLPAPASARSRAFALLSPGLPRSVPVSSWKRSDARAYPVGWFDTEAYLEALPLAPGESGEELAGGAKPLSPEADFLRRLAAALQPPVSALTAPNGVLQWPAPLLPYQQDGVTALLSRPNLLLADDMGLGKSVMTIAALRILLFQERILNALIVCPASLLTQWRRELARWAPDVQTVTIAGSPADRVGLWRVPAHVRLVGYETLRADVLETTESPVAATHWDLVVLDEASRIKNRESGVAVACKRLNRDRRWALTGTPLENRLEDVVSLLEFLTAEPGKRWTPPTGNAAIIAELRERQLRRKKEDVLRDLPPKQINELAIELLPAQKAAYERAEQEGIVRLTRAGDDLSITHVLELIARLKQICNADPVSGESAKMRDIAARIGELAESGHRALVFSQFTDATFGIERLAQVLRPFAPLAYTGAMSPGQRVAVVDRFIADPRHKALLLSLRAGGMGLNLQAASYVFHLDRWWNPALEEQADSRAHRLGQTYPVTVFRYICAGTIEERIDATLKAKRRLFQEIVDDVSLDLSLALSESELFGLFGLASPRRHSR